MHRVEINEKRLDNLRQSVVNINRKLDNFSLEEFILLNEYYGSNDWFDDRDDFDKGKLKNIKAGVLSEDAVWLLNEYVRDLIDRLRTIVDDYDVRIKKKNKNCNCSKDCKCGCHKKINKNKF